jgi:sigma-E factor negative regulatory protein RseB
MRYVFALALGWLAIANPVHAGPGQQEALQWLQKVADAAHRLSYSGTFVYHNGRQSETSRIVHVAAQGRQAERLEVLDGSPREVVRENDEVRCYLPDRRMVIVEQRSTRRTFPALLPVSLAGLGEHYAIRLGATARVAGIDSQVIHLDPRDSWRFGREFRVDRQSGLLLKADTFDALGESLESMAFVELQMGVPASADALKPRYDQNDWEIRQAKLRDIRDDGPWLFRADIPGFRRQAAMQRSLPGLVAGESRDVLHWVFSDGLAALSVFVSPVPPNSEPIETELQTMGAISVINRMIDGYRVVVMGDVPPAAIRHFAAGIEVRSK